MRARAAAERLKAEWTKATWSPGSSIIASRGRMANCSTVTKSARPARSRQQLNEASRRAKGPSADALMNATQPVPRLAPTTTQMESVGSSSPPATERTVRPTTTAEDCTSIVSTVPKMSARTGVDSVSRQASTSGAWASGRSVELMSPRARKIRPKWKTGRP